MTCCFSCQTLSNGHICQQPLPPPPPMCSHGGCECSTLEREHNTRNMDYHSSTGQQHPLSPSVSLILCLSMSVCLSHCLSLPVYLYVSVCLSLPPSVCLSLSVSLCLSLYHRSAIPLSLCLFLCLSLSVCLCITGQLVPLSLYRHI